MIRKYSLLLLFISLLTIRPVAAVCELPDGGNESELQQRQDDCLAEIDKTQNKILDYNQQVNLMDNRIKLTTLKITQTETEIINLEKEIIGLSGKIDRLDQSLDNLSQAFIERIIETYKVGRTNTIFQLFSTDDLGKFVDRYHYLKSVQNHDRQLLLTLEQTKASYDQQKNLKETAQIRLEKLTVQLNKDKKTLAVQKKQKEDLLAQTQNDRRKYQQILAQVMSEIASLKGFTEKQSGGILSPQNSPDGWYYSQRDSRWATNFIGLSRENIMDVGCLISDIAMIFTFYGQRTTPADIAGVSDYFYLQTAYMRSPWPTPSGKTMYGLSSLSKVDEELSAGRPVIVHLKLGGDGHFIVLKKKEGDDYIMHDPWEGYDKKFSDFYSKGSINTSRMVVYK